MLRLDGELQRMAPVLSCAALEQGMAGLLDDGQRRQWVSGDELDLALSVPGVGRLRLNLFRQRNGWAQAADPGAGPKPRRT
jgi:twitching motility protein PilT